MRSREEHGQGRQDMRRIKGRNRARRGEAEDPLDSIPPLQQPQFSPAGSQSSSLFSPISVSEAERAFRAGPSPSPNRSSFADPAPLALDALSCPRGSEPFMLSSSGPLSRSLLSAPGWLRTRGTAAQSVESRGFRVARLTLTSNASLPARGRKTLVWSGDGAP